MKDKSIKKNNPQGEISKEDHEKRLKAIKTLIIIITAFAILTVVGTIIINSIINGNNGLATLVQTAEDHPFITSLILIAINVTQVVIAFIPGEIVEQACGLLGPFRGTLVCVASTVTGSCLVIFIVRKFGRNLLYALCPKEKIDKISFLSEPKKRNTLTFLLFLIPGTPKDALTYAIGITDMSIPLYIALTTVARLPSIIMSTVSGDMLADLAMGKGNLVAILILNGISLVICGIGYLGYMLINKAIEKKKKKEAEEHAE